MKPLVCLSLLFVVLRPPASASAPIADPHGITVEAPSREATRNDAPALREALRRAVETRQGVVRLPAGEYLLRESVEIPSNMELRGEGANATRLVVPEEAPFDALILRDADQSAVRDLSLHRRGPRYAKQLGSGIVVEGKCSYLRFENVAVVGFRSGFSFGRAEGSEITHTLLRRCRVEKASFFGFEFNRTRELAMEHCYAFENRLDGIKLRSHVVDLTVRGGESSRNGAADPGTNGNGIDGYAGADSVAVYDMVAEGNNGSGFYFKSGPLNHQQFGHVRNLFFSGVRARGNRGAGLDINRSGGDELKEGETRLPPLVSHVTVVGGVFEENTGPGIYLRARDVTLLGPIIRRNRGHGIAVSTAWDVHIIAPLISGNGDPEQPERFSGISIGGPLGAHRINVRGGTIDGLDTPMAIDGNDTSERPSHHRYLISTTANSSQVSLQHISLRHASTPDGSPILNRIAEDRGFEWIPLP